MIAGLWKVADSATTDLMSSLRVIIDKGSVDRQDGAAPVTKYYAAITHHPGWAFQ